MSYGSVSTVRTVEAREHESPTRTTFALADVIVVEQTVREYFSDVPILVEIARCESHFRHIDIHTGQTLRGVVNSSDVGVMQINTYYHADTAEKLGLNLHDLDDNLAYARYLYNREGTQPWSASRACWHDKHLAMR